MKTSGRLPTGHDELKSTNTSREIDKYLRLLSGGNEILSPSG